jgi:phenylalanyl-tRNA synthetase beta chain
MPALTPAQRRSGAVRRTLAAQGLDEAVTWSFMPGAQADLFGGVPDSLRLANPISADLDVLRPSILPNLIAALGRNVDRGFADLGLFELGPAYRDDTPDGQQLVAAGARQGNIEPPHWSAPARPVDALDAKADALAALAAAGAPAANAQIGRDAPDWYHPGRSASLRLGKKVLAWFGEIHPRVLQDMGVRGPVAAFEVFLDAVPEPRARTAARPPLRLSPFQPVRRDFAFVVADTVAAGDVLRAARNADKALIADVALFDVYTGKGIEDGRKSLAIEVTLQPVDKTLTDAEIDAVAAQIVASVEKATGGTLRG